MKKHLELALTQIGVKEVVGNLHNPEVLKYFNEIGHSWVKTDEMAWCSAFVNWVCKKTGLQYTGKLNARSWMKIGHQVTNPKAGDIVVFWRSNPKSWKGHVGFFINQIGNKVYVLGGNQKNQVCIQSYPANRLLSIRRL